MDSCSLLRPVGKAFAVLLTALAICLAVPGMAVAAPVDFGNKSGGFEIKASPRSYSYTGKPVVPTLVYVDKSKGTRETQLVEGVDFEITGYRLLVEQNLSGGVPISYYANLNSAVETGRYFVKIRGKGSYTGETSCSFSIGMLNVFSRVAGVTAYDTMEQVSLRGWNAADTVILATGENYPDALAAAGVAGLEGAPVLITKSSDGKLSEQASRELARLAPAKLIVVGGSFAVPESVLKQAKEASGATKVVRLAGRKASDTAAKMNREYAGKWSSTAFLATSKSFQDALSAAPLAYSLRMPIFLVDDMNTVSKATYDSLAACGIRKVIVLGGRYCVSDAAKKDLASHGITVVNTLAGKTCYDTSYAIATWGLANGAGADCMGAATARNYPDALTGAALCGKNSSVLILVDDLSSSLPKWWTSSDGSYSSSGGRVRVGNGPWITIEEYNRVEAQAEKVENAKVCCRIARKYGGGTVVSGYVFGGRFAVSDNLLGELNSAVALPYVIK